MSDGVKRKDVFLMRKSGAQLVDNLVRFASVLATLIIGVAFAMVTSASAAAPDKKLEVNAKEKIEKIENIVKADKLDSKARVFNRRLNINNNRLNNIRLNNLDNIRLNNNKAFVRPLFINPFVDADELLEID